VTTSVSAVTPLNARARVGTQTVAQTLPVGLLPLQGDLSAQQFVPGFGTASMEIDWSTVTYTAPGAVVFRVTNTATLEASVASLADTDLAEILLTITAPSPMTVDVEVGRQIEGTPGTTIPLQEVDIGADGSAELNASTPGIVRTTLAIGPQPLTVIVRTRMSEATNGSVSATTYVVVTPSNDISIVPAMPGCSSGSLEVWTSFTDRGIVLLNNSGFGEPEIGVFGLGLQPVVLPGGPNCLLLPSPDLLMFLPYFQPVELGLPASVRPVTFWVQGVVFGGPFGTTNGFWVSAS
jgi:hypothetical protein